MGNVWKSQSPRISGWRRRRRIGRAGLTLVEVMIALAISSLVMIAVASLQYMSGRIIKDTYGEAQTRSLRMRTLDQIRYRLARATTDSIAVTVSGHQLTFRDPVADTVCQFAFNPDTRILTYDDDLDDYQPAREIVKGPIDITFDIEHDPISGVTLPVVRLTVKSASHTASGDVDTQDGETSIYLRNTTAASP
ncbi:MAG: prepilin-type N-terminal cleavage/methylation domain-containing protein [bacterium]|nr:prepilin-type N-terminal cleavage/methylation domain-containing protein [bacterium]